LFFSGLSQELIKQVIKPAGAREIRVSAYVDGGNQMWREQGVTATSKAGVRIAADYGGEPEVTIDTSGESLLES
jgi:hypothetical protein